jgi:branched-chain amino acid transport system permease protein
MVAIQILEQILNGLLVGAYYLLIALGLSLIFSLGGLVNLAHGAFYALGAYFAVKLGAMLGFAGVMVASPALVAIVGLFIERFLFSAFLTAPIRRLDCLVTFGLAMIAEQTLRLAFGAAPIPFSIPMRYAAEISSAISSTRSIGC